LICVTIKIIEDFNSNEIPIPFHNNKNINEISEYIQIIIIGNDLKEKESFTINYSSKSLFYESSYLELNYNTSNNMLLMFMINKYASNLFKNERNYYYL